MEYVSNRLLTNLQLPFEWKGTPVDKQGRFVNHEIPHINSFRELLKWQLQKNPQKAEKKATIWQPEIVSDNAFLSSGKDCLVWFGHASYFIRLAGISMLIDPVFFNVSLVKRHTAMPVDPALIKGLDYILVSHNHRDHCDEKSLRLLARNNPHVKYLTGLKMELLLRRFTGSDNIETAGWYQQYNTGETIRISYLPARHWAKRGLTDFNTELWGAFVIQGAGKTIYFASDSGYGSHFADVARVFPEIDYCMIGIGAYKPTFFMSQSHTSPQDAVKAFNQTHAKVMIPMHYGTFDLADEPMDDPIRVLYGEESNIQGRLMELTIGQDYPL
jgi:L-ascorbate metabolism protein UlaG (beta-lactamase superfamily)